MHPLLAVNVLFQRNHRASIHVHRRDNPIVRAVGSFPMERVSVLNALSILSSIRSEIKIVVRASIHNALESFDSKRHGLPGLCRLR